MLDHLVAIAWAQWKTARNHLPRSTFGSLLAFSLAIAWYGGFATFAVLLALVLPRVPLPLLERWFSAALFGLFLLWQLLPLATASGGLSLDIKRLQVYPIKTTTLLTLDALLRVTTGVEMLLILLGMSVGLLLHPALPFYAALTLLLFVPFNLLVSLALRDFMTRGFKKGRLREVFTVLFLSGAMLPQLAVRLGWLSAIKDHVLQVANAAFSPWHSFAGAVVGPKRNFLFALSLGWIVVAYGAALRQFGGSLREEETLRSSGQARGSRLHIGDLLAYPATWFSDPLGALINKDIHSLLRMPRFRVVFALSILFSVVLSPLAFQGMHGSGFLATHSMSLMSLYGLIMLADALMWNMFGFDRNAAQIYFAAPVSLKAVLYAKNIVAALFLLAQASMMALLALAVRNVVTLASIAIQFLSVAVVTTFFLAIGNVCSVVVPRAIDPKTTMRKQGGGAVQLWILGSMACAMLLLGLAYLAEWATDSQWASTGVLAVEWIVGMICYRVASEYTLTRASQHTEEILQALSKQAAVTGS